MNQTDKGELTRSDIIECARQLFYQQGYEHTSFSDIVETSGLSRGNIYHYFKTKDDILMAVISRHLEDYRALLAKWETEHKDEKERLIAFADMIAGREAELVEYGCPIGSLNTELAKDRRDLQQAAGALFNLFRDWLTACLQQLGKGAESEAIALHLLGRAQGIAVISHVYRDPQLLQRETRQLSDWIRQL
jgi:TetR/AcrR family transcriptional repressor of nem operon